MADKMFCPGCDSYTSGVLSAYRDGRSCPVCGLSHEATEQILAARAKHADEVVTEQLADALKQVDKLNDENRTLRYRLKAVERALTTEPPGW